jgi:transcriptional regulator with XRE-family HTH domain
MDLLNISQKVRAIRQKQDMTVAQLAEKSGLSKGFISRLENFRINASVNALVKISEALGISINDLFAEEDKAAGYVFSNLDQGEKVVRNDGEIFGINYFSLAFKKTDRKLEPFLIEYKPSERQRDFLMHSSDEFFILLEGNIIFYIGDEKNSHEMTPGDTLYLSKNLPHKVRLSDGCDYAKAITVYDKGKR